MVHREIQLRCRREVSGRRSYAIVWLAFYGKSKALATVFGRQESQLRLMAKAKYTVRTKRTKTTTELTVEQETFVALRGMRRQRGWCNQCFAETSLITAEAAAAASHVSVSRSEEHTSELQSRL